MSLSNKMEQARFLLRTHFASMGEKDRSEELLAKIAAAGGTSDGNLEEITPLDLEQLGLPRLLSRKITKVFGGGVEAGQRQVVIVNDDPVNLAARLKPEELVAEYDPNDASSPFAERLKLISKGYKFLVFNEDGNLNVPLSQKLLREILDGYNPRKSVIVNGKPEELFAIGERPARYACENPYIPGDKLRPDGFSDAHVEWGAVPFEICQLIHIVASTAKLANAPMPMAEFDLYESVQGKSFGDVARRFSAAAVEFEKRKGMESLPSLKVPLQPAAVATK